VHPRSGYDGVVYYVPFAAAVPLRSVVATAAPRASRTITVAALALAA